ncbi:lipopolysaccharide biosynthesis protein [Sphingomonas morindae]|uniref:Lipopolysaccharide biosynthesis protein n=1 Tax=Sphingomonas morindae TaxID=1541170 RepID=A0ABY4X660_9SPHN|nr:lipopolysaccharide biosynthesis protein [Sphingomonas morindae]USI72366.1 lipopolysaccharide biosynthesis protein [Sphingomonas morindae]
MNMHGFIAPAQVKPARPTLIQSIRNWIVEKRIFLLIVVAPTLLVAAYLYLVAADQYETEAHFTIQSPGSTSSTPSSFGDLIGFSTMSVSQSQAMGVGDYLASQEAVDTLQKKLNLIEIFRRPGADPFYKLKPAYPTPERLHSYYEGMVTVRYNRDTGISTLQVRTFRPGDSFALIQELLKLGEQRVNQLNERAYADAVSSAERQLSEAEDNARQIEREVTNFRQTHADVDPMTSGEAQTTLVKTITGNLVAARAQLDVVARMVGRNSPQYKAMDARVRALSTEVDRQAATLTGGSKTIAARLGNYEDLRVRQQFAGKRYDTAAAALEKAREQARRQSLYLVRIVDPSMPVKALYPHRLRIVATMLITLLVAYGIGWLVIAGVKEHAI